MGKNKLEAVAFMVELESGLTFDHYKQMFDLLPKDCETIPFEASENYSQIIGLMTIDAAEELIGKEHELTEMLQDLCNDLDNERTDKMYTTSSGFKVFIDCDIKTARGESELAVYSSSGEYVRVKTEDKEYSDVIVCPKPYQPWKHLLESSNGDVVEVLTADIQEVTPF